MRLTKEFSDSLVNPLRRASLGNLAYERILEAIVSGSLACGTELNEAILATKLNVSRTPVREALKLLSTDGLVQTTPNRPASVANFFREDVIEIYQIRESLEVLASGLAAEKIPADVLAALRRTGNQLTLSSDPSWDLQELEFDSQLHRAIAKASGNGRLEREILRYNNLIRVFQRLAGRSNPTRLREAHREHLQVLDALEEHNPDAARAAMGRHIRSALAFILEDLIVSRSRNNTIV